MKNWTAEQMPNQQGRIAVVTGANSGLGYETSVVLAQRGAHVVMACRNLDKAEAARKEIAGKLVQREHRARLTVMALDLGDLSSVANFADAFDRQFDRLDLLINNAGIMAIPRRETADGFEMQFGVNHLAHFALTGRLLPLLLDTAGSRVVTVTSSANYTGSIDFDDLMGERNYSRYGAYSQSKLANVMFTFELQRRLAASSSDTIAVTAHPGFVITNLQQNSVEQSEAGVEGFFYRYVVATLLSQSVAMGILPQLYAATATDVQGGDFYGPRWIVRGYPRKVRANRAAYDIAAAQRLWDVSVQLTGVDYSALAVMHHTPSTKASESVGEQD